MASLLGPDNLEMFQQLLALGIDPIYLWFFPPGFVHPKLLDPTGYTPPSLRSLLLGCAIFTTVVSTVALAFRLVSRGLLLRQFGWADGVIVVSWVSVFYFYLFFLYLYILLEEFGESWGFWGGMVGVRRRMDIKLE